MFLFTVFSRTNHAGRKKYPKIIYSFFSAIFLLLLATMGSGVAYGAEATLAWDPNNDSSVTGYKIYWGTQSQQYALLADVGNSVQETISDLQAGTTYYFSATAYDAAGNESDYSNEVSYTAPVDCTYSLTSDKVAFSTEGGTGTINVTTQDTCTWTASSGASWMTITSNSTGTGSGAVSFTILPNTETASRTATLSVEGQTLALTQQGAMTYTLTTSTSGTGTGTVTSNPSGTTFVAGTIVTLTATAGANSTFTGWSGCTGTGTTCQVTMNSNTAVTANFQTASSYTLTVTKSGSGTGTVTNKPSGTTFKPGTAVTLTARPLTGSVFTGWSGACSGTAKTCKITMTNNMAVQANFDLKTFTVSASAGSGGTISPTGTTYAAYGSTQSYTITPDEGYKVSKIKVDGKNKSTSSTVYRFSKIKAKHTIAVYFTKR